MSYGFMDVALTPSVLAAQAEMGADHLWTEFKGHRDFKRFTEQEAGFIAERDSFYMATVSETGWPYVQHRGGPPGFLKMIDDRTLAFLDYRGNRQYISTGNLRANDRACLILVDYPRRARLKIYGHIENLPLDADPAFTTQVTDEGYRATPERISGCTWTRSTGIARSISPRALPRMRSLLTSKRFATESPNSSRTTLRCGRLKRRDRHDGQAAPAPRSAYCPRARFRALHCHGRLEHCLKDADFRRKGRLLTHSIRHAG